MSPRLKLRDIAFFERSVQFARPFRFGAITINATPQLFVRVEIEVEGRGVAVGASAGTTALPPAPETICGLAGQNPDGQLGLGWPWGQRWSAEAQSPVCIAP